MSNSNIVYTSRWSAKKSLLTALVTLAVCCALYMVLPQVIGGDRYVRQVKGGHPNDYPKISYSDAFESFYSFPEWRYAKTDGMDIVIFTGQCTLNGNPVNVELRYQLKDNYFRLVGGKIDGQEQSLARMLQFDQTPFTDYKK